MPPEGYLYRTEAWCFTGQESLWGSVLAPPYGVTTGIENPFLDCAYTVQAVGPTGESIASHRVGEIDAFCDVP